MAKKIRFIKENDLFIWEVGDTIECDNDGMCVHQQEYDKKRHTWNVLINATVLIKKGYAEWVEEKPDVSHLPYGFMPKEGESRYHINDDRQDRFDLGNCYKTKELALKEFKRQKAIVKLWRYSYDLQGAWESNWDDDATQYYVMIQQGRLAVDISARWQYQAEMPHFKTREYAEKAIDHLTDEEWSLIFRREVSK